MDYKRFYAEFGRLMYAVAMADGKIQKAEYEKLKEIVRKELIRNENNADVFGTDTAFYTEFEFDVLEEQNFDAKVAYQSFFDYLSTHKSLMDENLKNRCLKSVNELALAYKGITSSETRLIDSLKQDMEKALK
jgi:uncharacterized tellurite resistance protein B-like protein